MLKKSNHQLQILQPAKLSFFKQNQREYANHGQELLKKKQKDPERKSGILEMMVRTEINKRVINLVKH